MAKTFGRYLKEYEGTSWRGRLAARHWRTALRNDYLNASEYTSLNDVQQRLQHFEGSPVHVAQGVATVWLQYRAELRANGES